MAYVTYTAKREIEPSGFSKTGTDFSAIASDDSIDAATTNISGLLTDQWLQAVGFAKNSAPAPLGGWFQVKSNSTSAKVLTLTPPISHLRLPGVIGNYASTPDTAAISIVGDIDIRAKVAPIDWTVAALQDPIAKFPAAAGQRSYLLRISSDATLQLVWSADGSAAITKASTIAVSAADGTVKWIRATLDVNNGAGGNDVKFYTSDDGVAWTQLGTTVTTAGVTSIFDGTAVLEVGGSVSASLFIGRVYYAEVRNGIDGTIAAAFDPTRGTRGASSLIAATGETWTINTSGTPPALLQGPLIVDEGAEYLSSTTVSSAASTPDSAALTFAGDTDFRVKVALTDYTPAATAGLLSKTANGSGQLSFQFYVATDGKLHLFISTNGTASSDVASSVATGLPDGSVKWLRVTRASSSGTTKFYLGDDYDPSTGNGNWTQLGTDQTTSTGAIFDSTSALFLSESGISWAGKTYYAELRNGINGTVVSAFDPGRAAALSGSLVAYTGETWTILSGGSLVRTTPVTVTGYKRGFGQSYSIEFKAEQADRSKKVKRSAQQPIGGGAPEVLRYRNEVYVDVLTEILDEATQLPQFLEFLASVEAGEVFTFDRYGTIASPVDPRQAMLSSEGYEERRSMTSLRQRIPFQVRLLS